MVTKTRLRLGTRTLPRLVSLGVWGLAFGCAVYWGLQLSAPGRLPAAVAASGFDTRIDTRAVGRVLGQTDAAAPAAAPKSRYDLLGVLRRGDGSLGAAIISTDGQAARTVVVGQHIGEREAGVSLSKLGERSATLAVQNGEPIELSMQELPSPYAASNNPPASAIDQRSAPSPGNTPVQQQAAPGNKAAAPATPAAVPGTPNAPPLLKPSFVPAPQTATRNDEDLP